MTALFSKLGIPFLCMVIGFSGGMIVFKKLEKPVAIPEYKCPDCKCPAAVSLQAFDVGKLKNTKGTFNYSPSLNNVTVVLDCADSAFFKRAIQEGLMSRMEQ